MARPLETTNTPARSCRQTTLRQLATKVRAMRHAVKAPQPNLTWRLLRSRGIMWRVKVLKYQGNAPARIGQLNHSCRQCGHCLSSWTNRHVMRNGSSTVRAAKLSMTAGFGGGERCIYDSLGLTPELSDAGGPGHPNRQLRWPARIRSSDFVSSPVHRLSNQRTMKTSATTSASVRRIVSRIPATTSSVRPSVQRIRISSLYREEKSHRQPRM